MIVENSAMKIICVIGTRPEAIKMAPVILELKSRGIDAPILATAQHRNLLDQVLSIFNLEAAWDLDVMQPNQNLSGLISKMLPDLDRLITTSGARAVLAQGDTSTVFAAALASFHSRVPFGHVEAGLRSGLLDSPFPEEGNRRLTSVITKWHFAPTEGAKNALRLEGIPECAIEVVGNTVIDALMNISGRPDLPWPANVPYPLPDERLALVTLHRRENFGGPLENILNGLKDFAQKHPRDQFVYPVHPNPNVREPAFRILGLVPNFHLIEPLDYPCLVHVLQRCYAVFTDSGGLQEEGPALGKPVLVLREVTERPEAVEAGGAILVGSDPVKFVYEATRLWEDSAHYSSVAVRRFPYGVGHSAQQIVDRISHDLNQLISS